MAPESNEVLGERIEGLNRRFDSVDLWLRKIEDKLDHNTEETTKNNHETDLRLATLERAEQSRQYWIRLIIGGVTVAILTSIGGAVMSLVDLARSIK